MVRHPYEGTHIVENYLEKCTLDEKFKYQVLHIIGSHMKEFSEYVILTSPKMLEVIVFNYGDSMNDGLDKMRNDMNNAKKINYIIMKVKQ